MTKKEYIMLLDIISLEISFHHFQHSSITSMPKTVVTSNYKKTKPSYSHLFQEIEDEEPQEYKPRRRKRKSD